MKTELVSVSFKSILIVQSKKSDPQKGYGQDAPRITANVKQNLQFLKLLRDFQKRNSGTPRPATSYRKKKAVKEEFPEDIDHHQGPTTNLYYTNQGLDTAGPVLLVDGYNVCGYWTKLKKHLIKGRLDIARQKLTDELITFSVLKEVKVVVAFDAMMSGLPTHTEDFAGVGIVFSGESCADAWIEKEVNALKEDGCPKVWVVTSDLYQQQAAHGAGAFVWSCKAFVSEIKASQREFEEILKEQRRRLVVDIISAKFLKVVDSLIKKVWVVYENHMILHRIGRSTSMQGKLLKFNLDPEVVDALKDLKKLLPAD